MTQNRTIKCFLCAGRGKLIVNVSRTRKYTREEFNRCPMCNGKGHLIIKDNIDENYN